MADRAKDKLEKRIIHLDRLTPEEKKQLAKELYEAHSSIFSAVSFEQFYKYVFNNPANENYIQVYKHNNMTVGYISIHRTDLKVDDQNIHIFRFEAGMLREYRGLNLQYAFIVKTILKFLFLHPFDRCYYLGTLVHPSSYCNFSNYMKKTYPNYQGVLPVHVRRTIAVLKEKFNFDQPFPENEWVTTVGWVTKDTKGEEMYWQNVNKPNANFFLKLNPHYRQGYGLITLVELDIFGMISTIQNKVKKFFLPIIYRTANISPQLLQYLYRDKIKQQLHSLELFHAKDITKLIKGSYPVFVPRGSFLFQQGDVSNGLYILISGSVYVLMKNQDQQVVIDQIPENNVIGEIGSLTKLPRTASVRAATNTIFIKISQYQINKVLDQLTSGHNETFKKLGTRLFENYLNTINNHPEWVKVKLHENKLHCLKLTKGQCFSEPRNPPYIFLFSGFIEIKSPAHDNLSFNGQSLVKLANNQTLHAIQDSFLLIIESSLISEIVEYKK